MKILWKFLITIILGALFFLAIILFWPQNFTIMAQNPNCQNAIPRLQGLLTTPQLQPGSKFGNTTGQCILDPIQAGIVSFKIPTYDELKNIYFQRKTSITTGPYQIDKQILSGGQFGLDFRGNCGANCSRLWNIQGDLRINTLSDIQVNTTQNALIFVDGNFILGDQNVSFTNSSNPVDIKYADNDSDHGIAFIVKKNVNIGRNIHTFNGLIIAQGDPTCTAGPTQCYSICTAVDGTCAKDAHSSADQGGETKQLIVNGNLISLDANHPIFFQRNLVFSTCGGTCSGNDSTPAEKINHQPKYFLAFRNLLSETLTIQTEDTHYAINQ